MYVYDARIDMRLANWNLSTEDQTSTKDQLTSMEVPMTTRMTMRTEHLPKVTEWTLRCSLPIFKDNRHFHRILGTTHLQRRLRYPMVFLFSILESHADILPSLK